MLGTIRVDQTWSQISEYFTTTPYDNVFITGADGSLLRELTHLDWRRAMVLDFNYEARIVEIMPFVEENLQRIAGLSLARSPFEDCMPKLEMFLDADGKVADVRPKPVRQAAKPVGTGLIMAGGFGRRLGDIVSTRPKPMLDVSGRPIAEHLVRNLVDNGVTDIVMSLHHLPDVVRDHFGDGSEFGCRIRYTMEEKPLGTAGCLSLLPDDVEGPLVVVNGDVVTHLQFSRLLEYHIRHDNDVTMAVRPHFVTVPYGVVDHQSGLVKGIREKPRQSYSINAAIYVLSDRARELAPSKARLDMPSLIERALPLDMSVSVFPLVESWIDVGSPVELTRARESYDPLARPELDLTCRKASAAQPQLRNVG